MLPESILPIAVAAFYVPDVDTTVAKNAALGKGEKTLVEGQALCTSTALVSRTRVLAPTTVVKEDRQGQTSKTLGTLGGI